MSVLIECGVVLSGVMEVCIVVDGSVMLTFRVDE